MQKANKHIIIVITVSLLVIFAWSGILSQTFIGEGGFAYFFRRFTQDGIILRFNIGAGILMDILVPLFKDNFFLYQSLVLISFTLICILFYFFVYELTKHKIIGFIAAILFGVNYGTLLEMLGLGYFGEVVERVFFLIVLLPSFILFLKFKKNIKWYYYIGSLVLCIVSVFLAHFNMFFITFFPAYMLAKILLERLHLKKAVKEFFWDMPFLLTGLFIIYLPILLGGSSYVKGYNIFSYVFNHGSEIAFHSARQLTILSIPDTILRIIFGVFSISYKHGFSYFFVPVILVYACTVYWMYKKEKMLRLPLITSALFLIIVFALNMHMRGDNVAYLESGSRYLFVPSLGFSIYWAIFLSLITQQKKSLLILVLVFWFTIQYLSLGRQFDHDAYKYIATKHIISYVRKNITPKLEEDSIVIAPKIMSYWGSYFLNLFYGKQHTVFFPRMEAKLLWEGIEGTEHQLVFNPEKDFILGYDYNKEQVVDLTKDYKEIIMYKDTSK